MQVELGRGAADGSVRAVRGGLVRGEAGDRPDVGVGAQGVARDLREERERAEGADLARERPGAPPMLTGMLLIDGGPAPADTVGMRTGGVPLVPDGFVWPVCAECGGNQQFLVHLPLDSCVVAVFFCQNDPGMCDDWDPASGANRAYVFDGLLAPAAVPADGETQLGAVTALHPHPDGEPAPATVLGRLAGDPDWIQNDETPACPACTEPMTFTAQLEEGADHATAANFGSGRAYVFRCHPCAEAAFLWQC
ncbi:hypothetical protein [Streptomyces sp. NPDC060194]|uniref:hypothetical protein n=1 Tax=Streptomyces sp. NPDC060194 TaxID=3347069 RepID=UPI0036677CD5